MTSFQVIFIDFKFKFHLSGQMVAKVGRHVRELSSDKYQISNIFALDPAGPGFEDQPFNGMEPISSTDADYVQVIHTNGGNLGMQYRCGTIGRLFETSQ